MLYLIYKYIYINLVGVLLVHHMLVLQVVVRRLLGRLVHGEAPGNRVHLVVAMVVAMQVVVLRWCHVVAMETKVG